MYIITISLLLFCNLFIQTSTTKHAKHVKTRKFNSNFDECVCFPLGQSLVPELLNPQGHELERLVVFLYRDVNNNQIKIFLPSPDKQALIPNIPFEDGDLLKTVTTETMASLFQKDIINSFNKDQAVIDTQPIGWNWGEIHEISPNPNPSEIFQEYPPQGNPQEAYLPDLYNQKQQFPGPNNQGHNFIYPEESNNPYQPTSFNPTKINLPETPNWYIHEDGSPNKMHLTFDQWLNRQMTIFQDIQSSQDIKSINIGVLRSLVQKTLSENHMYISSTGLISDANGVPINFNNLKLRPILIGNSFTYHQALTGEQQLALPKDLPYLAGLLVTLVHPPKILGIIPLGETFAPQPQSMPLNAVIEHYTDFLPVSIPEFTDLNAVSSATQPNNQWTYPNSVLNSGKVPQIPDVPMEPHYSTINRPRYPNKNLAFYSANKPHASSISSVKKNNAGKQRSNKTPETQKDSKSNKLKLTDVPENPVEPNGADSLPVPIPKSWFKENRLGADSLSSWKPSSQLLWKYLPNAPQNTPNYQVNDNAKSYMPVTPVGNQMAPMNSDVNNSPVSSNPFSNSPSSNYKQNSHPNIGPIYITPNAGSDFANNWQPHLGLTASPYIDPSQNLLYSNSHGISQPPVTDHLNTNTNWISPSNPERGSYSDINKPNWSPIATTAYNYNNKLPVRSPYLRSQPIPYDEGASHEILTEQINSIKPEINTISEPTTGYKYSFVTNYPNSIRYANTQNAVTPSRSFETRSSEDWQYPMPMIQGVIKSLINMVLENLSEGQLDRAGRRSGESAVNATINIGKTGEIDDGGGQDFRIIGGSAATGSGSPLSNKGRSGLDKA